MQFLLIRVRPVSALTQPLRKLVPYVSAAGGVSFRNHSYLLWSLQHLSSPSWHLSEGGGDVRTSVNESDLITEGKVADGSAVIIPVRVCLTPVSLWFAYTVESGTDSCLICGLAIFS